MACVLALGEEEVRWEWKWKQEEGEGLQGPHPSAQMQKWAEEGFFKGGVWVRRAGTAGEFYSSKRIDFDLYT